MPDPVTAGAAVGWGISALGWFVSPIISKLLSRCFSYLGFDGPQKLGEFQSKVFQLELILKDVEVHPPSNRLEELLDKLKSAFYEAEDILDDIEHHRLERQILYPHGRKWVNMLQSAIPMCSCLTNQDCLDSQGAPEIADPTVVGQRIRTRASSEHTPGCDQ
jgi:hypothetical protein